MGRPRHPALPILSLLSLSLLVFPSATFGQSSDSQPGVYPAGLTFGYGVGAVAVRDENISNQRYAGTLPDLALSWARDHGRYVYRTAIELRKSDGVRNHSVGADITRFSLEQAFLYPLRPGKALGRDLHLFLGPTAGLTLLVNEQRVAVDALGYALSTSGLFFLGVQGEALMPLSQRVNAHGALRVSVLSLGFRGVDDEIDDESPVKPVTLLTGADVSLQLGARYRLTGHLSFGLAYLFQLHRVTAWRSFTSASDSIIGGLTWRF
ncbi:hypothetical protein ACFL4Y_00085 [Gemmatimonadota bacterium]